MHPGAWLAWALGAGFVALATTNPLYLLPLFASAWVVHAARSAPGPHARSFRLLATAGVAALVARSALVLFGPVTTGSVAMAVLEGLRLAVLLGVFGAFNSVADTFALLRLAPRRWHEPVLVVALALSLAPRTLEVVGRVREAQRLRGIDVARWRSLPALAVPVLEGGMEQALTLAESMDARGHGRGPRSRYRREPFTWASALTVAASGLAATSFAAASVRGWGELAMTTLPLAWPRASIPLLAAVLSFALPAFLPAARR